MPRLNEQQQRLSELRAARDDAHAEHRRRLFELRALDASIADAERRSRGNEDQELERLRAERERARAAAEEWRRELVRARADARDHLGAFLRTDPWDLIEHLDDGTPFLLLPVRIETKFADANQQRQLLVRIFPDDIAITAHEKILTVAEVREGQSYWKSRALANAGPTAQEQENAQRGAWSALAGRSGALRAKWIAQSTKPTNWSAAMTNPLALVFEPVPTKPAGWSDVPRSFVMPDRFVVVLISGEHRQMFPCAPILDDLPLGPDPLQVAGLLKRDPTTHRIVVDGELKWLLDFEAAVEAGMALRIALPPPWNTSPIEKLVVLGIRASEDAGTAVASLQKLIEGHRYSTGISLLAQGTPTNNTEEARSGFSTASSNIDAAFEDEQRPPLAISADPIAQTDGQRLAEALGLPIAAVSEIPGADLTDVAEGLAMNRALWPATMGGFLRDMMRPLISDETIELIRRYFASNVLGRGLLPALRVGNQPYGIVATSSVHRWKWTEAEMRDGGAKFWNRLLEELLKLENKWSHDLLPDVSYVGKAGDAFAHLMNVVGLQASSVEFYTRKAITNKALAGFMALAGTPKAYSTGLWEEVQAEKFANLFALGLIYAGDFPLKQLIFWREHEQLTGSVVDEDPRVPLSEEAEIHKYDNTHNYIDWLTLCKRSQIESQEFFDAAGKRIAPPVSLLYKLLRHSYLAELGEAGVSFAKTRLQAFAELPAEPLVANIGANKVLLKQDVLNVDTYKAGATATRMAAGDYLLEHARALVADIAKAPEAIALSHITGALRRLARLPTARLERAFAEHLDVCSYRLDAWIQGLFARRLGSLRPIREQQRGVFLGAWGYVENLVPSVSNKVAVPLDSVPEPLRKGMESPVVQLKDAGGYIHAPSMTHAVTAAVLRGAYISHASSPDAQTMSVNLTSSRVRSAQDFLEGLRNGQDLAALLGYQIERGLHEGYPGVELDEFIYVLRDRFPLISRKVTPVPDSESAEVIEARNVINGYDLLEHVRQQKSKNVGYPFGLAGLTLDSKGNPVVGNRANALELEMDRLANTLDAIGDLMLSESVHQVAQGNYDRASGNLQSLTEGESPPDIEVVQTPRSGRQINHRVALHLDPTKTQGWRAPLTPRASLSAPMNHWLASLLPTKENIQWQVTVGGSVPQFVGADSLGIEPLDLVLMCGETFGEQSTELERLVIYVTRQKQTVPDTLRTFFAGNVDATVPIAATIVFDFMSAQGSGIPIGRLWPLLRALKLLVARTRPLHANDYRLPGEAQTADPANPRGYDDVPAIKTAVTKSKDDLKTLVDDLDGFLTTQIRPAWDLLNANHVVTAAWDPLATDLRKKLLGLSRWGIPEALPANAIDIDEPGINALVLQAQALVPVLRERLDVATQLLAVAFTDPLPADATAAARAQGFRLEMLVEKYTEAARVLVGKSFALVPTFNIHMAARAECDAALGIPIETDEATIENWFRPLTRTRTPLGALGLVATFHEWLHPKPLTLVPIQLPVRPGDTWIAQAVGPDLATAEVLSLTLCNPPATASTPQCGLLIDEWTELVPPLREVSGIAFQANRPNAQPPHALLLAIAPELRGAWKWDDLLAIVLDTVQRAKLRAVEPEHIVPTPYFQLLPTVVEEFSKMIVASIHYSDNISRVVR